MNKKVKEIKRLLDLGESSRWGSGRVSIDSVDYYWGDNKVITVDGFIEVNYFIAYLGTPQGEKTLNELIGALELIDKESDEDKLRAIIDYAPQMVNDEVWGVYLEF